MRFELRACFAILLLCFAATPALAAMAEGAGALPWDWYHLPEEGAAPEESRELRAAKEKDAAAAVERLLKANSAALDKVSAEEDRTPSLRAAPGDWKFAALILDLSVSASGMLGVLMAKGEASAAMYWRRKAQERDRRDPEVPSGEAPADLAFTGGESEHEIEVMIEPLIRAIMATGEVKDEPALRHNVLDTVLGYRSLVQEIRFDENRQWFVSKLRLDFSADASGRVHPTVTVGGGVRLRFEWDPTAALVRNASKRRHREPKGDLRRLLATLANEMQTVDYSALEPMGFAVSSMKFGLGLYGEGKFGVVKVGATVMGHVSLAKRDFVSLVGGIAPEPLTDLPVIEVGASREGRELAEALGIRWDSWAQGRDSGTVYHVPKDAFRKGLQKAARIGRFFVGGAAHSEGKRWEPYLLKTEFALSLAGTVGIVTIGGTGAMELAFNRTEGK